VPPRASSRGMVDRLYPISGLRELDRTGERLWGRRQGERVTVIVWGISELSWPPARYTDLSRPASHGVQSTPEANLSARLPLAWIDNTPLTSGLVFQLQTPCSDLERSPLFHSHRGGNVGSRLSATRRHVWSRAVCAVLAVGPLRARRLRAGLAAVHHGGRAAGRVRRGHENCCIRFGQRPGALPGHGTGPFHRLHWYHVDVSGTIKGASSLCPERSVVGGDRGCRPLPSVSRHVTRGHVSSSTDIVMPRREGL
jgi:hypothetical protein